MYDIVTIGSATRDAFIEGTAFRSERDPSFAGGKRLCVPAGSKIEVSRMAFATGGGATNAAVTFARQKLSVACVAKIGNDVSGEEIIRGLTREGVDCRYLSISSERPTAYSMIITHNDERTVFVYRGASELLKKGDVAWEDLKARWWYIVPGTAIEAAEHAILMAKRMGIRVALNPSTPMLRKGPRYMRNMFVHADVLLLNREEGSVLTGIPFAQPKAIFKKIDAWMPCLAVLTDGARGVMVSDGVTMYHASAFKVQRRRNGTGAGDAFGSGFIAGLLQHERDSGVIPSQRKEGAAVCDYYSADAIRLAILSGSANAASVIEHTNAKEGLLTKKDHSLPRWKRLRISEHTLHI